MILSARSLRLISTYFYASFCNGKYYLKNKKLISQEKTHSVTFIILPI